MSKVKKIKYQTAVSQNGVKWLVKPGQVPDGLNKLLKDKK